MKTFLGSLMVFAFSLPACGGGAPPPAQPAATAAAPSPEAETADEPTPPPPPPAEVAEGPGDDNDGDEDGDDGVEGGVVGGVLGDELPPPPPPPPAGPNIVPQQVLEAQRLAGDKHPLPNEKDQLAMKRAQQAKVVAVLKMCVSAAGAVDNVAMLKSSGYPDYDKMLQTTIEKTWKYRPFTVNGKAVPVCTSVTFIYNQRP